MPKLKAVQRVREAEVVDLPAVIEDRQFTEQAGLAVREFLGKMTAFFTRAGEIEVSAKARLAQAKTWIAPTTMEEDENIQQSVKAINTEKKAAADHWDSITSTLFGWHRRAVAGRVRPVGALEEAALIGNRLHNGYAEAARRRAAEEQDRVRRQAENDARQVRERELAELEMQALKREESSPDLSEREQYFIDYYVLPHYSCCGNAEAAACRAGYKNELATASRLMSLLKIQKAIKARQEAESLRRQALARREQPLEIEVPTVQVQVSRAAGAHDMTRWGAECLDAPRFIEAIFDGSYGIPRDVLMVNPVKLNEYGRSLHERIDLWPGVRHTKKTTIV